MGVPWPPADDYDHSHVRDIDQHWNIGVGYDVEQGQTTRFLDQLRSGRDVVAQTDHDPSVPNGHDLYSEGIHVDIYRVDEPAVQLTFDTATLPRPPGRLHAACIEYLVDHRHWFLRVYTCRTTPTDPPPFW